MSFPVGTGTGRPHHGGSTYLTRLLIGLEALPELMPEPVASPVPVQAAAGRKVWSWEEPSQSKAFSNQALLSPWLPKSATGHPEPRAPSRACSLSPEGMCMWGLHAACVPADSHMCVHRCPCRLMNAEALNCKTWPPLTSKTTRLLAGLRSRFPQGPERLMRNRPD